MDSLATVKITYASADTKDLVLTLRKAFNLVPSSHIHKRIPFPRFPTAGTNLAGYKPVVSVSPILLALYPQLQGQENDIPQKQIKAVLEGFFFAQSLMQVPFTWDEMADFKTLGKHDSNNCGCRACAP